jgi:hypothetical protein
MPALSSLLLLALVAWQTAMPDQLVLSFTATDKKGKPIEDLKAEEVQVIENGKASAVDKVELDRRPLSVALVVDTGSDMGSALQADLVPAAIGFVERLPPGSTFSVWVTSDRPKLLAPDGSDVKAADKALRGVASFGSNAAVDTMVAASQELAKVENRRTAVVAVTSASMGAVTIDVGAELARASLRPVYLVVEVIVGNQDARLEDAVKMLSTRTGGFHERVFTTMSVDGQLRKITDLLSGQYRAGYRPTVDPRSAKVDVKTSRKNTRLRMSQRLSTGW